MRHQSKSRRFGRPTSHRLAMFTNLVTSLFVHERLLTTLQRAKELRRVAEKLITLGKRGDLAARRLAASRLRPTGKQVGQRMEVEEAALKKLFETIAPRFKDRHGGYTRIIKTAPRHGDNASMAFIELIPVEQKTEGGKKAPAKKSAGGKPGAKSKAAARKPAAPKAKAATPKKAAPRAKAAKSKEKEEEKE